MFLPNRFPSAEKCVKKPMRSRAFLNQLRKVGKSDETIFRVNDITSQTVNNPWRNSEQTFAKCYEITPVYIFTITIFFSLHEASSETQGQLEEREYFLIIIIILDRTVFV